MTIPGLFRTSPRTCSTFLFGMVQVREWAAGSGTALHQLAAGLLPAIMFVLATTREEIYNILWALVFGFATLNILSLGARRFEQKSGLNFGEVLAILVVLVSIVLLGWELLYTFHILPIRLTLR